MQAEGILFPGNGFPIEIGWQYAIKYCHSVRRVGFIEFLFNLDRKGYYLGFHTWRTRLITKDFLFHSSSFFLAHPTSETEGVTIPYFVFQPSAVMLMLSEKGFQD